MNSQRVALGHVAAHEQDREREHRAEPER